MSGAWLRGACLLSVWSLAWTGQIPAANSNECLVTRAVLDIGSGSTKLASAEVDKCQGKILKIKTRSAEKVKYKEDLLQGDGKFSEVIQIQGRETIKRLLGEANLSAGTQVIAVATSVFREAQNAQQLQAQIEKEFLIKVDIISQEEEARLGLKAAMTQVSGAEDEYLAWDIGGGSMQLTTMENGQLRYSLNGWGSSNTKKWFLTSIQQKEEGQSPLPAAGFEIEAGVKKLSELTRAELSQKIRALAKKRKTLGLGGVLYFNICPRIPGKNLGCEFSREELEIVLKGLHGKDEAALGGGAYVDEAVTNPMLVLSFMKNLGIEKVQTLEVNLSDGILIDEAHWR